MEENLSGINLGKTTENDFKESDSNRILREFLEKNRKIKVRMQESDKIPNLDGKLEILDGESKGRITVEIQVKTLPNEYNETNPYIYDCDTKVFNVVFYGVTFNPVVLFLVDTNNEKVYWKYVSYEYAESLKIGQQKSKRINFTESDLFVETDFLDKTSKVARDRLLIMKKGKDNALLTTNIEESNPYFSEMQEEIDRINNLFDKEFKHIKDFLFPDVWKFGIAYSKYDNGCYSSVYTVKKGQNNTLIKNFDLSPEITSMRYVNSSYRDTSVKAVLNDWLADILNAFYNRYPLNPKFLHEKVLSEIVFQFLDRLSYDIKEFHLNDSNDTYFKDEEDVEKVIQYVRGLKTFCYKIYLSKGTDKESPMLKLLLPALKVIRKFIIFNLFIRPNEEEYNLLIESINNPSYYPDYILIDGSSDVDFNLLEATLIELRGRKITTIKRVWQRQKWKEFMEDRKTNGLQPFQQSSARGYLKDDLYKNLDIFFDCFEECLDYSYKAIYGNKCFKLSGEYLLVYDKTNPYHYLLFAKKAKDFKLKVLNKDYLLIEKEYSNLKYYKRKITGSIDSIFSLYLPLYTYMRLIMNISVANKMGYEFKFDSEANRIYSVRTLPLISDLSKLLI